MRFSIRRQKQYAFFTLADRIEWEDARQLDDAIKKLLAEKIFHIVFDLNEITYICSAGIGALVYNLNIVRQNGGAIYIISSNDYIEYMFQTLKFDMVFDGFIYPSMEEFTHTVIDCVKGV